MILLSALLGLVIVYNSSLMAFNERRRELASLKVLGYSNPEIAGILRKETWLLAAIGIVFACRPARGWVRLILPASARSLQSAGDYLSAQLSYGCLGAVVFVAIGHYLPYARQVSWIWLRF
jgi:putative ABC transport system permease protein